MQQQPVLVDVSNKLDYKKIVPQRQLLTSHEAGWQNVVFEHHRQPPHEMPEINCPQHILLIHLKEVKTELKMDNRFEVKNAQIGDILLIPADLDYWTVDRTNNEFIVLAIEPRHLLHSCRELIKGDTVELIPAFPHADPFIYGTALALKQELETNYNGCRLYAESLLNSLCFHLLHKYATTKPLIEEYKDGLAPYKLKQVLNLIGDCLSAEITIEEMANQIDLSPSHFARQFKKSTGLTPHQYVTQQRINRVKLLLKERKLSITDIAYECGFTHQSHMGKAFKRHMGVTPKQYRNKIL